MAFDSPNTAASAVGCKLEPFSRYVAVFLWQNNGVSMLAELIAGAATEVRSAAMGALMMITTVDAGEPWRLTYNTPSR